MMKTPAPIENGMISSPPPAPPAPGAEANPRLRRRGLLLMVGAGLCWSTGGVLVRKVGTPDPWEIVLWRSVFMVLFLFAVLAFWHGRNMFAKIAGVGFQGALSGFFLASTFFFFILSVTRNTVANTLVLMSTGPFFVAFFGKIFLTERIPRRTWMAIGVALLGIVLMFSEGLDKGQSLGNLLALGVPTAFAFNIVILWNSYILIS
jgi:drug/metabolite transporter (DMT)-like permease